MKRYLLLLGWIGTLVFSSSALLFGQGQPGVVHGRVRDSGGGIPANGDFDYSAYLTNNPGQVITRADVDNAGTPAYDAGTGTWVVQLSLFTSWNVGDVLHIDFTDAGGPGGVEHGAANCTIQGTNTNCGDVSLPVELSVFEARAGDSKVLVVWKTESETDNLGFYLYRSEVEDGEYTRITDRIIRSKSSNSPTTQEYRFLDSQVQNGKAYYYKLEDVSVSGARTMHGPVSATPNAGLSLEENQIPDSYGLGQNYPNPFNPGTQIEFQLPEAAKVRLTIYNLLGQKVRLLVDANYEAGYQRVHWDGRDDFGNTVSAGIYLYELVAGNFVSTKKMVMMK